LIENNNFLEPFGLCGHSRHSGYSPRLQISLMNDKLITVIFLISFIILTQRNSN